MIVINFDLSSRCVGIVFAKIAGDTIEKMHACSIIPETYVVSQHFPYQNTKKKIMTGPNTDKETTSYVIPGEQ